MGNGTMKHGNRTVATLAGGMSAMTFVVAESLFFDPDAPGAAAVRTKADSVTLFDDFSCGAR